MYIATLIKDLNVPKQLDYLTPHQEDMLCSEPTRLKLILVLVHLSIMFDLEPQSLNWSRIQP